MNLDYRLAQLLREAAEAGANAALVEVGKISPFVTKAEAYRKYGRTTVDKWISEGVVKLHQDSPDSKTRLSRVELLSIASSQNLVQYINTN